MVDTEFRSSSGFIYGADSRSYALTKVTSSTGVIPAISQTATYTSFEKVNTFIEGVYAATFAYNSDNQRARMVFTQSGSTILTRWYVGSSYLKQTEGSVTKEYTWIGGDAYSAPCLAVTQGGATTWYYLLRDHLGSITHVTDASGNMVDEYSFDAWGRRRNFTNWSYSVASQTDILPDRGFTRHEFLKYFNLYNMNGRLYDPLVARFLNVDPYVPGSDNTQAFNRYTYGLNNPLKFVDPDGEFPLLAAIIFSAYFGGARSVSNGESFWTGAWKGGIVGAVGGALAMIGGAGMPFITNLAIGTGSGAITGGLDAALWGNDIGKGLLWGAAAGAVFTTLTSENFSNMLKGEGFHTNENVFNNMIERGIDKKAMLDYFGFEGTYTGTTKGPSYVEGGGEGTSFFGSTNPKTGNIRYGDLAFDSYDKLKMTYKKEMYHSLRVKNGVQLETQGTEFGKHLKYYPEERLGFIHAYKNHGLYPSAGNGLMENISFYQMQSFNLNPSQYYNAKWWHLIFKIPRRW